jgi:uncharacterized protein (TIGR00725 family)
VALQVAVCGSDECSAQERGLAYRVGELLAEHGAVVVCGGGAGVMAAVAQGARSRGGLVIGIRPDLDRATAFSDLSAVVLTGMGEARNAVIVASADAVIAVGGSWGTLSEIALAKRRGKIPVICLGGWRLTDAREVPIGGITYVATPEEAVAEAVAAAPSGLWPHCDPRLAGRTLLAVVSARETQMLMPSAEWGACEAPAEGVQGLWSPSAHRVRGMAWPAESCGALDGGEVLGA